MRDWRAIAILAGLVFGSSLASPGSADPLGQSAELLFPAEDVSTVRVSPSGAWVSASALRGRFHGVLVQRSGRGQIDVVIATESPLLGSWWVGADTLISVFSTPTGPRYLIARMVDEGKRNRIDRSWVDAIGWLVHPLPRAEGEVLWAFDYRNKTSLHRVTLDDLRSFREDRTSRGGFVLPGKRLATINGRARGWITDVDGNPRAVVRHKDATYQVLVFEPGRSSYRTAREIAHDDEKNFLEPVGVSADGRNLIVRTYHGRDTIGLYEFDPSANEVGDMIFRRPDVDVSDVVYDFAFGALVAAVYEADGDRQFHYLGSYGSLFAGGLAERFPLQSIEAVSGSLDRRFLVVRVSSSTDPGTYYLQDVEVGEVYPVASRSSSIDRKLLSEVTSFLVESSDGLEIEAFLTLPNRSDGSAAPLVVMPHGGPIGVRDSKRYDPIVQYLASWGFAVLQPNYRGSTGYGLSFLEAGKKQWAERIEDDIDAAVASAMARPEIDQTRICILGGSYGGFSALASVIRHKNRYRCAISWNGVSDIPLLYDSSDIADSKRAMEFYEEYVGDLETERAKLVAASPAYQVERIDTPVFIVFGDEDRRVDPDHSHRVLLMLETLGKESESLEIKGMSHGYTRSEGIIIARAMRRYLTRYLFPEAPFEPDPELDEASDSALLPEVRLDL